MLKRKVFIGFQIGARLRSFASARGFPRVSPLRASIAITLALGLRNQLRGRRVFLVFVRPKVQGPRGSAARQRPQAILQSDASRHVLQDRNEGTGGGFADPDPRVAGCHPPLFELLVLD